MPNLFERYFRLGFFTQVGIAFLYLGGFVTVAGGYATLQPSLKSFALHYLPCLLLAALFVAFCRLFSRFQR